MRYFHLPTLLIAFNLIAGATIALGQESSISKEKIEAAVKQFAGKLKVEKACKAPASGTVGSILSLTPCSPPSVPAGPIFIEMTTELGVAASEPTSRLLIQYLFCWNVASGKLVLKQAHSLLLNPGTGVCGIESADLELTQGTYEIYGRVTVRNSDGSESVKDEKSCRLVVQ